MRIDETLLPGVGVRYDIFPETGAPFGVLMHRDGAAEFVRFDPDDPDQAEQVFRLSAVVTAALADILGAPRVNSRLADLSKEVPGLQSIRIKIDPESAVAGKTIGQVQVRTRTGCSIVAVVRDEDVVASPSPDEQLQAGSVIIAIGGSSELDALDQLVATPKPGDVTGPAAPDSTDRITDTR